MDEQQNTSLQRRVEYLEATVAELQRTLTRIEGGEAQPQQLPQQLPQQPPRQPQMREAGAPAQVFCWNCRGGNPPGAAVCIWCGRPLSAGAAVPPPPVQRTFPPPPRMPVPPPATPPRQVRRVSASNEPEESRSTAAASQTQDPPARGGTMSGVPSGPRTTAGRLSSLVPRPSSLNPARPAPSFQFNFDVLTHSEFWINKVGIGLLLLGLAFLFKYSLDQGWLSAVLVPPVRIAFGLALGSVLLVFGIRMHSGRRYYSRVLIGGSVAAYYITGFASYEWFNLVPYWLAFGFMVGVTLLAFAMALWQNESILSLIGTTGALATPFLLPTESHDLGGLLAYTSLVLAGTGAVYLFRGWRSLLWTAYIGAWSVLVLAYSDVLLFKPYASAADRWALQAGVICVLLVFWGVPLLREVLWTKDPARWPYPVYPSGFRQDMGTVVNAHVYSLSISASLLTFFVTNLIWDIPNEARGLIAIGVAAVYGAVAWGLRKLHKNLAYMQMLLSLLFLTVGFALLLHGQVLMLTLALEAAVLHAVSRRLSNAGISISGHIVSLAAVLLLADQMSTGHMGLTEILGIQALIQLAVIALLLAASTQLLPKESAPVYRLLAHGAMIWWLWRELSPLPDGTGYVLIAWSLYALALLALSSSLVMLATPVARVASMISDRTTPLVAHAIFLGVGVWLAVRVAGGNYGATPVLNPLAIMDVAVILLGFAASFLARPAEAALAYRIGVHLAVLGWLARELSLLSHPLAYTMLAWAAYATLLHFLAPRQQDRLGSLATSIVSHAVFGLVVLFLAAQLLAAHPGEIPVFNPVALMELAVIGLALVVGFTSGRREEVLAYLLVAHIAFLAWVWRELSALDNGNAYVTVIWGVYALGLMLAGVRLDRNRALMYAGISTLFLVVAKLLLVDLALVEPIWRILLFLGFGGVFLMLSYYLQNLTRRPPEVDEQTPVEG